MNTFNSPGLVLGLTEVRAVTNTANFVYTEKDKKDNMQQQQRKISKSPVPIGIAPFNHFAFDNRSFAIKQNENEKERQKREQAQTEKNKKNKPSNEIPVYSTNNSN